MKKYSHFLAALAILSGLLTACNPVSMLQSHDRLTLFDDAFQLYSKHLRWGHYRQLTSLMTEEHIADSLARIPNLKNRRVSRIEATEWSLNKDQDKSRGIVEISYYATDEAVIRQVMQEQTWIFQDERWLLDAPLPNLR